MRTDGEDAPQGRVTEISETLKELPFEVVSASLVFPQARLLALEYGKQLSLAI